MGSFSTGLVATTVLVVVFSARYVQSNGSTCGAAQGDNEVGGCCRATRTQLVCCQCDTGTELIDFLETAKEWTSIKDGAFDQGPTYNKDLEEIVIGGHNITHLQEGALKGLPALTNFKLATGPLETIDESTFADISTIEEVQLQENAIKEWPPLLLTAENNPNLNYLQINDNEIVFVPPSLTEGRSGKQFSLDIRNNNVRALDIGIEAGVFGNWRVSGNPGVNEPQCVDPIPYFERKTLEYQQLFVDFPQRNQDEFCFGSPREATPTPSPTSSYTSSPSPTGSTSPTASVTASATPTPPPQPACCVWDLNTGLLKFCKCPDIETLDLSCKGLTAIKDGAFDYVENKNIRRLYMQGNSFTEVPRDKFYGLHSLTTLSLGDNAITDIATGAFDGLTELRNLYLEGNLLTSIEAGWFEYISSILVLNLMDNNIDYIEDDSFQGIEGLEALYLRNNNLLEIGEKVFRNLMCLIELDLDENPGYDRCLFRHIEAQFIDVQFELHNVDFCIGNDTLASATPTPSTTPTNTPTRTGTPTVTPTRTSTPSSTSTKTPTNTATNTRTPSHTSTSTPTSSTTPTSSHTGTSTPSNTGTPSHTGTSTPSNTGTPSHTGTSTPSNTGTPSRTGTPTASNTATNTQTPSNTGTATSTGTSSSTATSTPSQTSTGTPSNTATSTSTRTPTGTSSQTSTGTSSNTASNTPSHTPTNTVSNTPSATSTGTASNTATQTGTSTPTSTGSGTGTPSVTGTNQPLSAAQSSDSNVDAGAAIGITIGVIVAVILSVLLGLLLRRRRNQQPEQEEANV